MKADTLADPAVEEFAGLVRRLNNVVASLDTMAEIEMLQAFDELLPLIYAAAHRLPDVFCDDDDDDEEDHVPGPVVLRTVEERTGWWKDLREKFGGKLGWHRVLKFMYDPFPGARRDEHEVMGADLADILADSCLYLAEGSNSTSWETAGMWNRRSLTGSLASLGTGDIAWRRLCYPSTGSCIITTTKTMRSSISRPAAASAHRRRE